MSGPDATGLKARFLYIGPVWWPATGTFENVPDLAGA